MDVNKAIMRCLVKNLGMFGLGLYIYAGEDLPETEANENAIASDANVADNNVTEADVYNYRGELSVWLAKRGLSVPTFAALRAEAIREGSVPDIPSADMKKADAEKLFAVVEKKAFGKVQ